MIKTIMKAAFACAFFAASVLPLHASEGGTAEEAKTMVYAVIDMVEAEGTEKTFEAVTAKKFVDRDLYPFMFKMDGTIVAHGAKPSLVGKNISGIKDAEGTFFVKEMIKLAAAGGDGWVDYKWPNPVSNKIEDKSAFIENIGSDYFVGVGIHPK
ncbi:MAG: cache domain-containing protein [Pseudomonadota bacterium]